MYESAVPACSPLTRRYGDTIRQLDVFLCYVLWFHYVDPSPSGFLQLQTRGHSTITKKKKERKKRQKKTEAVMQRKSINRRFSETKSESSDAFAGSQFACFTQIVLAQLAKAKCRSGFYVYNLNTFSAIQLKTYPTSE